MIFHASLGGFQPVQRRESAFLFGCWGGDNGHMCPKLKERSIIFAHFQVYHSELVNPSSQLGNIPGLLPWTAPVVRYPAHLSSPDIATIREHFSKTWVFGKKNAPDYDSRPIFGPYHKAKDSPHGLHLVLQILAKTTPKFGRSAKRLAKIDPPSPIAQGHPPSRDLGSRTLSVKGFDAKISWMSWMSPFLGVHFPALLSSSHSHAHHAGHSHGRHALTWHQGVIHVPFKKCERYKFAGLCLALTRQVSLSLSPSLSIAFRPSPASPNWGLDAYIYIYVYIIYIIL